METRKNFFMRNIVWVIIIAFVVIVGVWGVGTYNFFIAQDETITTQWAQVENQLKRRFDLIPNIVNTVKGIANQEKEVFGAIADARTRYAGAATIDEKAAAAGQVESALGRLLVVMENYPQLASSQSFRDLTVALEGTENRIATERMKYNDFVRVLNTKRKTFPSSLVASIAGVDGRAYFEVSETEQENPTVDFSN